MMATPTGFNYINMGNNTPDTSSNLPGFLVLAAGLARRFGGNKLTAPFNNSKQSVLETLLNQLPPDYPVHVVCRPSQQAVIQILEEKSVPFSGTESLAKGMGHSIAHGVSATQQWAGWIICLADMPWVQTATYQAIATHLQAHPLVVPFVENNQQLVQGNPVGFDSSFATELLKLRGPKGGRSLIASNRHRMHVLKVKDSGILLDIDYPNDINIHSQ